MTVPNRPRRRRGTARVRWWPMEHSHRHRHLGAAPPRWEAYRLNRLRKTVKRGEKVPNLSLFRVICPLVNEMLSLLVWLMGLLLELAMLIRAVAGKTVTKFPYFYAYVVCVFGVSAGLYILNDVTPASYYKWYWPTQFATLVAGCGVVVEDLAAPPVSFL